MNKVIRAQNYIWFYDIIYIVLFIFLIKINISIFDYNLILKEIVNVIILLLCVFQCIIYEPIRYRNRYCSIDKEFLKMQRGVLIRNEDLILVSSIKGIEIKQYIYQRLFGIYNIIFYLNGKSIAMYDINREDAVYLENEFSRNIKDEI